MTEEQQFHSDLIDLTGLLHSADIHLNEMTFSAEERGRVEAMLASVQTALKLVEPMAERFELLDSKGE